MLRRIARAFLASQVFALLTQSKEIWSILRWLPRSLRYYAKDASLRALNVTPSVLSTYNSQTQLWPRDRPLLSVIISCYNYGQYIREAVQSVRSQTYQDLEIIIVDDGSTDAMTVRVLKQLREEGINIISQEHAPGPAKALNLGISAAVGKYVCCLNADDTIEPTYLEKCLLLLESNPGVGMAYPLVRAFGEEHRTGLTQPFNLRLMLAYNQVCAGAVFRRDAWKAVGGYDESMPAYEDWDFWIRLGEAGFRGKLIPEPLFNWRRHPKAFGKRVDERRPELLARIRSNHSELFSHRERIEEIQRDYYDCRVSNPFANLSSESLYFKDELPLGLIVTAQPPAASIMPALCGFLIDLEKANGSEFISVVTAGSDQRWEEELTKISKHVYNVASLLDPYCWLDFVINLISTRRIRFVLIAGSKLGYDWAARIKEHSSASIVDVLHEPGEAYVELSGRHDSFLDFHVTFSERVSESLTDSFGFSKTKVGVIPPKHSRKERNDQYSMVLSQVGSLWTSGQGSV
jgi:glycosyltransferase involved in cell wall biosynthesis